MAYVWIMALGVSAARASDVAVAEVATTAESAPSAAAEVAAPAALGDNPSCLVSGTWFSDLGGRKVETSFGAGNVSTVTADGRRAAAYEVVDGQLVLTGGSLGRARDAADSCAPGTPATYRLQWSADCWEMALVAVEEPCARREAQLEGRRWTRE